jgi:Tub family
MGIEAREMEKTRDENAARAQTNEAQGPDPANDERTERRPIDLFSAERNERGDSPNLSYLEEKCMFWFNHDSGGSGRRISLTTRANFAPPAAPILAAGGDSRRGARFPGFRPDVSPSRSSTVSETLKHQRATPKIGVKVHRHLVDQHLMGRMAVEDENGNMRTLPVSLAADFFHPPVNADDVSRLDPSFCSENTMPRAEPRSNQAPEPSFLATPTDNNFGSQTGDYGAFGDDEHFARNESLGLLDTPQPLMPDILSSPPPPPQPFHDVLSPAKSPEVEKTIFSSVHLDMYSSASASLTTLSDHKEGTIAIKSHLKARFAAYQRKLEASLGQSDSNGFEEVILDFWDEFFPVTANIQFYDRHTAVPRLSGLQKFMTKPCPKAIGTVQCEIERIKMTSKKKGVNMKGRLFPTYEYRLFIRDRRYTSAPEGPSLDEHPIRRDTVLMTAKNRGRNYQDLSGVVPAVGSSKKGVNNYYLHLPKQVDIDTHFNSVNTKKSVHTPNGASNVISNESGEGTPPVLLGRLQSNFIGTEFQIFTPTLQKRPKRNVPSISDSDNDLDYDSGVSSDTNTPVTPSRRRNRFSRRSNSRKKNSTKDPAAFGDLHPHPDPIDEEEESTRSTSKQPSVRRSYSLPIMGRSSRSSRRAVAHSEAPENVTGTQHNNVFCEEEDGAITYTANLLGNRPRMMDVCVPRVTDDAAAAAQWKRYLESIDDPSDTSVGNRMLTHFKQLQQRLENTDQNNNIDDEAEGIAASEYTAPDDFGLLALQNRPPWWNVELGAFVLNFGGRVSVASVKNFQLCDRSDQDHIMLQFGRIQGRHSFTMDFQFPLTPVQAFAIAISSLQSRISFG